MRPRKKVKNRKARSPRWAAPKKPRAKPAKRRRSSARAASDGLVAEMFRQHSLVEMLSARMLETADALDHDLPVTPERVRRALRIHRGFLIEFHIPSDAWVAGELGAVRSTRVERVVRECASEPKRAAEFQASAGALIESSLSPGSLAAHTLATIFRTEAARIERHHAEEGEVVEPGLGGWVPTSRRRSLLSQIRRLYRTHVKDELALVAWASQNHPSSD